MNAKLIPLLFVFFGSSILRAQLVTLEGYVYESGNRGYLNEVKITVSPKNDPQNHISVHTDQSGFFSLGLPKDQTFTIRAEKQLFHPTTQDLSTANATTNAKVFAKLQLNRKPGYLFDVTLAEERDDPESETEGISGALIEIYNNTTNEASLVLKDYPDPNFSYTFQKGNHYTLLIRKAGYFGKRLEAYVDVEGCILCFDGLASIENVTDNLTEGLTMGSLLANIELRKATVGSTFKVENIFYDLSSAEIRADAAEALDGLALVLKDNPSILVELGSHTDSRGEAAYNAELSQRRAQSAVNYLVVRGVDQARIQAKGYGEAELTNDCSDGVECTPGQHQMNRRTEIKVLGKWDAEQQEQRSLAEIKEEENFNELLKEVQEQEVVQFGEDEEMPEDLRQMLEAQATEDNTTQLKVSSQEQPSPPKAEETVREVEDLKEATAVLEPKVEDPSRDDIEAKKVVKSDLRIVRDPAHKRAPVDFEEAAKREKAISDLVGLTPSPIRAHQKRPDASSAETLSIPSEFSGFMIELKRVMEEVPADDIIFALYGEILEEQLATGEFSYLIAGFDDFDQCYLYFEEKVQELYPNAKIIEFLSGKRL